MTARPGARMQGNRTGAGRRAGVCPCIRESPLHPYSGWGWDWDASAESGTDLGSRRSRRPTQDTPAESDAGVTGNRTVKVVLPGSESTVIAP